MSLIKNLSLSILLFSNYVFAANYDYNKLRFMEYNELRQIKNGAINTSRKFQYPHQAERVLNPLKEILKMFYARPDSDNIVSPLLTDLESELETINAYEKTLKEIIDENLSAINDKKLKMEYRVTAALGIKNLLLDIKPKTLKNTKLAKVVCELADKNVKLAKDVIQNPQYQSLYLEKSPSEVAKHIMLWYAKKKNIKVSTQSSGCPFSKRAT